MLILARYTSRFIPYLDFYEVNDFEIIDYMDYIDDIDVVNNFIVDRNGYEGIIPNTFGFLPMGFDIVSTCSNIGQSLFDTPVMLINGKCPAFIPIMRNIVINNILRMSS